MADTNSSQDLPYTVDSFELVAESPDLRVIVLTLSAGQEVPWHIHTNIVDRFYCLEGPMVVEHDSPGDSVELAAGECYSVPVKTPHRARGKDGGPCKFLIVQGMGTYDFVPVEV